jgi:pentatricopeptide repeat protein
MVFLTRRASQRRLLESASKLNARMINMAFAALIETGSSVETAAVKVQQMCSTHGLQPTAAIFNNVLGALSKRSPPEAVLAWIAKMRAAGICLDTRACNMQLKAHLSMRDYAAASSLLVAMMKQMSTPGGTDVPVPDAVSFNTVIAALSHAHKSEQASSVLNMMMDAGFAADHTSFTSVILAFAKTSRPLEAARVLDRMLSSGLKPDAVAFNTVLSAFANAADSDGARSMLTKFEDQAIDECPNAKPDVISYNTLILACARAAKPDAAEKAFEALILRGFTPTQVSYSTVISAHAKLGNVAHAQAWLDRMVAASITPDVLSYNTVCAAHAKIGDSPAAIRCMRAMEAANVEVTATTHAIMINALVQAGQLEEAERSSPTHHPLTTHSSPTHHPLIAGSVTLRRPSRRRCRRGRRRRRIYARSSPLSTRLRRRARGR